jgi:hypothetical protein
MLTMLSAHLALTEGETLPHRPSCSEMEAHLGQIEDPTPGERARAKSAEIAFAPY